MIIRKLFLLLSFLAITFVTIDAQEHRCAFDQVQQKLMDQNPAYQAEVEHYLQEVLPRIPQGASQRAVITIPVVVHVIHSGQSVGNGANLSVERIQSQIDILNEDYRRTNSDAEDTPDEYQDIAADTEIQFCLAKIDPSGNTSNGITRHTYSNVPDIDYIEDVIKQATNWDSKRYMNIWTIEIPSNSVIGYSYLPTSTIVGFHKDGIVIDYPNFGYVDAGNKGRTCVHEVGHYMGLQHTWGGADSNGDPIGCSSDDGIADTPNCSGPNYGCPNFGISSCGNVDMTMNYMEYVNDNCMNLFTNGQKEVMQNTLNGIRSQLTNSASTACEEVDIACLDLSSADINMGFESNESLSGWLVENTNGDTRTWLLTQTSPNAWGPNNGDGLAVYLWNTNLTTPADDYLFTPCFDVESNHTYRLTFSYACAEDNNGIYPEAFEIGFSQQQSSNDFNVLNNDWVFENVNNPYPEYNSKTLLYQPDNSGSTSIGFHVFSEANRYALQIDDIKIEDLGLNSSVAELKEKNTISLGPNPTTGLINMNLDFEMAQERVEIEVYDYLGRIVIHKTLQNVNQQQTPLDLSDHANGIYLVYVKSGNILLTEKIMLAN